MTGTVTAGARNCALALVVTMTAIGGTLTERKCSLTLDEMNCVNATIGDLPNATESSAKEVKFLESKIPILKRGDLFSFPRITDFVCLDCQLAVIEKDAFSASSNLITLEFYGNNLTLIDANVIENCRKIKDFVVSWNPSLVIPEDRPFLVSSTLTSLDLTGNELSSIFGVTFSKLPALKRLSLAANLLHRLPPDAFLPLKKLKMVDLSRNKFAGFSLSIFPGGVNQAKLGWNPWRCNCFLYPLVQWYNSTRFKEEVRCFHPRGVKWHNFRPSNCTAEFVDAIRQRKLMNRSGLA